MDGAAMKMEIAFVIAFIICAFSISLQAQDTAAVAKTIHADSLIKIMFLSTEDSVYTSANGIDTILAPTKIITHMVTCGEHVFYFAKTGYDELVLPLVIFEPTTIPIHLESKRASNKDMLPLITVLRVLSEPAGAQILLDGNNIGITPKELPIEAGNHSLMLQKELYYNDSLKFTALEGRRKEICRVLNPHFGSIEILSLPEPGADVFINNVKVGTTPYYNPQFLSNTYQVRLAKPRYYDTTFSINMEDQQFKRCIVPLSENYAELTIKAPWSNIFINDSLVGSEQFAAHVVPGNYKIRTERGWQYTPAEIRLSLATKDQKEFLLEPMPRLGTFAVIAEPYEANNADIYINGDKKGIAPFVQPMLIGDYSILARCAGFVPASGSFVIKEKEKTSYKFHFVSLATARQQAIARWSTWKWIAGGVSVVAIGSAAYFYLTYKKDYRNYAAAKETDAALASRSAAERNQKYFTLTISIGSATTLASLFSWFMQAQQ
jgi:hypothetical protein